MVLIEKFSRIIILLINEKDVMVLMKYSQCEPCTQKVIALDT